jgi:hypothetical protein
LLWVVVEAAADIILAVVVQVDLEQAQGCLLQQELITQLPLEVVGRHKQARLVMVLLVHLQHFQQLHLLAEDTGLVLVAAA